MNRKLNILICPLEWGLGHAARMIPVAREFLTLGHNVIIGSGETHAALFKSEVPGLSYIDFPGFRPEYSAVLPQYLSVLMKVPTLLYHIIRENRRLKTLIKEHQIDIVISDNRFGLWNRQITCVYVTHMPIIPFPRAFRSFEFIGKAFHRYIINKYTICLIPDLPGVKNFSGRLTHGFPLPSNACFTGILSRFAGEEHKPVTAKDISRHNTIILSGPEPQRGIFRKKLIELFRDIETPTIIFEGKPGKQNEVEKTGNISFVNHLPGDQMKELILTSDLILTRSGYTTIMELASLNRRAIIIPTPGQTEQEYLAEYLSAKGWFSTVSQAAMDNHITTWKGECDKNIDIASESRLLFRGSIDEILKKCHEKIQSRESCQ